jgi:N-acetylglucosaminyldiphosphoundecaprenol N-acetyl-beta-D-mannosaminyltransferase
MIDRGRRSVLGVMVAAVDYDAAVARIVEAARHRFAFSVSALAVHGVMTGALDEAHKFRLNSFDLLLPDGQPVRWALNAVHGAGLRQRVIGAELTRRTLEAAADEGLPVYFYGTTEAMLAQLVDEVRRQYPDAIVAGAEPSRFRALDAAEREALADRIVRSGAAIVFVGLGCPRQEIFVYEMHELVQMPMLAVGAAFAFLGGTLARPPGLMQRLGLEWLYRLAQEPRRLWQRYLLLNPYYLLLLAGQLAGVRFSTEGRRPVFELRHG